MADILAWIAGNPDDVLWGLCATVSVVLTVIGGIKAYKRHKNATHMRYVLNPVHLFTMFVFGAMFLMMVPVTCLYEDLGEKFIYFRPLLMAFNYTMRAFILDGGFADTIGNVLKAWTEEEKNGFIYSLVTVWGTVLYVLAPALTFVNVMSIFKNLVGELRYKWVDRRKCYIFSELNAKSVALAKSIRGKDTKGHIVFTDVFEQNDEPDFELLLEARNMRAICMKKDIAHVDLLERKGSVEVFLIGDDESENISQAVKITTELDRQNKKFDVKIFVFSRQKSGAYIIDSLDYANLLEHAKKQDFGEQTFKLRRINEVQQLVWNEVPEMKLYELARQYDNKIRILIVGMGSYGMEFVKMLLWFCQFEGIDLELTVVDKRSKEVLRSEIDRECPEVMARNRVRQEGEAYHDIEIIHGIDMDRADLEKLIDYAGEEEEKRRWAERLRQIRLAIVGMGDDNLNIETAVYLRGGYDRVYDLQAKNRTVNDEVIRFAPGDEQVQIYAIVYDEQKSGILQNSNVDEVPFLRDHKDVAYNIRFIGAMSSQFSYQNIYNAALEEAAFEHHVGWVYHKERVLREWAEAGETEKIARAGEIDEHSRSRSFIEAEKQKYNRFEYYRMSSMAQELYRKEVMELDALKEMVRCTDGGQRKTCQCENCVRRKRNEHMRWNAYMRVQGFRFHESRADRAMRHNDLRPWHELSDVEKEKDSGLCKLLEE